MVAIMTVKSAVVIAVTMVISHVPLSAAQTKGSERSTVGQAEAGKTNQASSSTNVDTREEQSPSQGDPRRGSSDVIRETCVFPSCRIVFGHAYQVDQRISTKAQIKPAMPDGHQLPSVKMLVTATGPAIVVSQGTYERCLPPSCYLNFPLPPQKSDNRPSGTAMSSPRLQLQKLIFVAADGTWILPVFDSSGNVIGATGRDAGGTDREIEFATNIESNYVRFRNPVPNGAITVCYPVSGQPPICHDVILPEACDSYGCNVYKTTMTATYSEQSVPKFEFKQVTDPFNFEAVVQMSELNTRVIGSGGNSSAQEVQYILRMNGTGEEHILDFDGNDLKTLFTIDRQHGNTMSITPKFDKFMAAQERVRYFAQVIDYMFIHQPSLSGGISLLQGTVPSANWTARLSGDFVMGLAAAAACAESAGAGCLLSAGTFTGGLDVWQNLNPGVVGPNGQSLADEIIQLWLEGICNGIDTIWELSFGFRPQIGCH
jgi:hypothetical protein